MDIPNKISKRGLIYFPDFCQLVLEKFRGDGVEDEIFRQNMFKVSKQDLRKSMIIICGIWILIKSWP